MSDIGPTGSLGRRTPLDVRRTVSQRLREHRIVRQWTQREMARRAGIAFETFRVFERTGRVSFDRFLRILDVLGLLDRVELVPPVGARSIDEVIGSKTRPPRQRVRAAKRSPRAER